MNEQDVLRAANEAADRSTWKPALGNEMVREFLIRFACIVADEAEQRERTRIMQNELQTLRDRLAKQKPRIWVYRDNPGITTDREPGNKDLWEPLGNIV